MSSHLYGKPGSKLPDVSQYIRLLHINPGQEDDKISCFFRIVELQQAPKYAALSYTWGALHPLSVVSVDGIDINITQNCYCGCND